MSSGPWQVSPGNTWRLNRGFQRDRQACEGVHLLRSPTISSFCWVPHRLLAVNSPCWCGGCYARRKKVRLTEKCQSMSSCVLTRQDCLFS